MKKGSIIIKHIVSWLIFICYEMSLIQITIGVDTPLIHYSLYYLLNIILFYFNAHIILDFAFFKTRQSYLVATALIFIEILTYLLIKLSLDDILTGAKTLNFAFTFFNEKLWVTNIWREIFFIGFSTAYWSMLYMIRFKERNHQMETEQLKSIAKTLELKNKYISVENAYLQNQISPHLLFNSLNFIYNQVYKESTEAGDSVSRLSDLMRYSLVTADDSRTVLLSQEVIQIENLIELCRMRFRDQFYLRFKKQGKLSTVNVIPLILITLVENMMKHGDLGEKKYPAKISLSLQENCLLFDTSNRKRNTNLYPKSGLGLKNIEKRLNNYYQDRYQLAIRDDDEFFSVNLTINL